MKTNPNTVCDLSTGECGPSDEEAIQRLDFSPQTSKLTLHYVTDPICSHCWALEPVLNRFQLQYGHHFEFNVVMGGLLPSWNGFGDRANGIRQPSDVAGHWREVGEHSRMPIDGSLWLDHPIQSSFPPSRVFKIIQQNHPGKEREYLRKTRERLFAFNENIAEEAAMIRLVDEIGLNGRDLVAQAAEESAQTLLEEDFALAARLGVRGFPTIVMMNEDRQGVKIVGAQPLETYVKGLESLLNKPVIPAEVPALSDWFSGKEHLFSKEIEVMYDLRPDQAEAFVAEQLSGRSPRIRHVLGELYI